MYPISDVALAIMDGIEIPVEYYGYYWFEINLGLVF
jgi:hypothetical protein